MTLQSCGTVQFLGPTQTAGNAILITGSGTSTTIDAAGEKFAYVFRAPKSGNISVVSFRTETVTTGDDVDVRLETIDPATGDPTGTLVSANANKTQTILDANDNAWFDVTLTAAGAVTIGDMIAIVIVAPVGFAGNITFAYYSNITLCIAGVTNPEGYCDLYVSAAWGKKTADLYGMMFRAGYDDGTFPFIPGVLVCNVAEYTFNSGDDPDEYGIHFEVPFKGRVARICASLEADNDATIRLYDTDGAAVLASQAIDKDIRSGTGHFRYECPCASPPTLTASNWHRLSVLPGAADVQLQYFTPTAAAHLEQMGLGGVQGTSRVDAGAWSQDAVAVPVGFSLAFDQLDDGAGGGLSFIGSRRNTLIGR